MNYLLTDNGGWGFRLSPFKEKGEILGVLANQASNVLDMSRFRDELFRGKNKEWGEALNGFTQHSMEKSLRNENVWFLVLEGSESGEATVEKDLLDGLQDICDEFDRYLKEHLGLHLPDCPQR